MRHHITKIFIAFFLLLAHSLTFAENTLQPIVKPWKFGKDDALYFILGEYSEKKLLVTVNATVNNIPADIVTVNCNRRFNRVAPGTSIICYPNMADMVSVFIDAADFKNGAEGTYVFLPLYS